MGAPRRPSKAAEQRAVDAFNAAHPVGTRVRYWSGARRGDPSGEGVTIFAADIWNDSAVVRIKRDRGGTDFLALTHVEPVTEVPRG